MEGPYFDPQHLPKRRFAPKDKWTKVLDQPIASTIGVPAGPLLNSKWVGLAAQLGFDVVTYKTIRSSEHPGHDHPNMVYVQLPESANLSSEIHSIDIPPQAMKDLAVTNSFGMPSRDRKFLEEDIPLAQSHLVEGQTMIVSVVGSTSSSSCGSSPSESDVTKNYTDFVRDFADVAKFAKNCGAKLIEANFSCPNVATGQGSIYQNPKSVSDIASHIVEAIGDTPLILKVGTFDDVELMRSIFLAAQQAKVRAICGINSVSMSVSHPVTKLPALGPTRLKSGVCGGPIRPAALNFIKNAKKIMTTEGITMELIGCGGITLPEHFNEFTQEGAVAALSATGMMWDPLLAARYHNLYV
eukprot:TRINITY_DN6504_c0_g1_i1.p1 TRINITY_DN6504_c0_g1~~TRINITY_DN6504_c0_g1_i1.p1  ORF type:complete len:388 (-),score=96.38 TRINITY_DN6504_c0_g1_i1:76-1140(-)